MNIATILLVFVVFWWLAFFMSLPFGVQAQNEGQNSNADMTKGTVPSAPINPQLKKKAKISTAIAFVLTVIYYFVATSGLISFRPPLP
jgi:predicted secreted protein